MDVTNTPSVSLCCGANAIWYMFTVDLTNGQLTPNNNTPLLAQALSGEARTRTADRRGSHTVSRDYNYVLQCVISPLMLSKCELSSSCIDVCISRCRAVMNNYQAAAAGFGPPASPHAAGGRAGFPAASSPGPALDVYGSAADSVGYVQAASPQPSGFPAIAVSRAPLNYTPVMIT